MKKSIISTAIVSLLMVGCGGSGSGSKNTSSVSSLSSSTVSVSSIASSETSSNQTSSPAPVVTGVFLDAAVSNIGYRTATQEGFTNNNGEFTYQIGELITFYIGDLELPSVVAAGIITPLDIANTESLTDNQLINILRLLQSLDKDGDASNGIEITAAAIAAGTVLDFTVTPEVFADSPAVKALLQASGSVNEELISIEQAVAHFQTTLELINGPSSSSSSQSSTVIVATSSSAISSEEAGASSSSVNSSETVVEASSLANSSEEVIVSSSSANSSEAVVGSSSSVNSSAEISSASASSEPPVENVNPYLLNEAFNIDKTTLFSAAYQSISTDATAAFYFITGGGSGITVVNNQLVIDGSRFTIGHRPPRTNTTANDTSANGDFDLSRPYRISFNIIAASGSGKVQVYVDNNTTSQGNSIHKNNSKVFEAVASTLTAGQLIEIPRTVGTSNSFIAIRAESSAKITIDNLVLEYTDGQGVSSSSVGNVASSSPSSQSVSSSQSLSSAPSSNAGNSSVGSSSSSEPYIPVDVNLSADCISLATNSNVNWRETGLQTDQEIVECLYESLGSPVGYGENAKGGFDPNGNSKLTIITKNSSTSVEQQLLDALTDNAHNWVVFDKAEFANEHEIGMYRMYCANPTVLSMLDATETECIDYWQWCARKGFNGEEQCRTEFFNKAMNNKNIPIRIPAVGSNKTIDGRMSKAYFMFSGFAIGKDADGVPTQTSTSVIFTHLDFRGAGHTEDHYVDPDMIRSTGFSSDIWIHKNTFDTTGDSAFDVKIGAHNITMSFNRLVNVKRAVLHGSSDSRTINEHITTTMHHNAFVTTDDSYKLLGNTLRRVPLLRRGKTHMFNNVFINYRKEILSLRVGAQAFLEDNAFVVNILLKEKSSIAASLNEIHNNYFKDVSGGSFRNDRNVLWFGSGTCVVDDTTKTVLTTTNGTVADLSQNYNAASLNMINGWRFEAGQDLIDYVTLTAGKYGDQPFNSPLSPDRTYMEALSPTSCQ